MFASVSSTGFAYCGTAGANYVIATECADHTLPAAELPWQALQWFVFRTPGHECSMTTKAFHSDAAYPYCNTINFIADSSDTFIMFGCDLSKSTVFIAYPIAGAGSVTLQSSTSTSIEFFPTTSSTVENAPTTTSSTTSRSAPSTSAAPAAQASSPFNTAAAIGGALGGFASVIVAILAVYKFWTKDKKPVNP
jgi:hypothetical protein